MASKNDFYQIAVQIFGHDHITLEKEKSANASTPLRSSESVLRVRLLTSLFYGASRLRQASSPAPERVNI
jgi:hypothetical protein